MIQTAHCQQFTAHGGYDQLQQGQPSNEPPTGHLNQGGVLCVIGNPIQALQRTMRVDRKDERCGWLRLIEQQDLTPCPPPSGANHPGLHCSPTCLTTPCVLTLLITLALVLPLKSSTLTECRVTFFATPYSTPGAGDNQDRLKHGLTEPARDCWNLTPKERRTLM